MELLIEKSRECLNLDTDAAIFHGRAVQGMTAHFLIQRNPETFLDPDMFNPARFEAEHSLNEMYTFSRAPHNCAGKQQALTAIKCSLAAILKKGTIVAKNPAEIKNAKPVGGFVLRFDSPLYIRIEDQSE